MATYITSDQLDRLMTAARLVDCTDDNTDGTSDAAAVADVIERASALLDEAAAVAGYTLPLTTSGLTALARHHVGFIAAHFAAMRRPEYRAQDGKFPYHVENDAALAWIARVESGKAPLYPANPTDVEEAVGTFCVTNPRRHWIRR